MSKLIVLIVCTLFCAAAWANSPDRPDKQEQFQKHKQERLQDLDQQIAGLQEFKNCISSANDPEGFKKCHEAKEARVREQRAQHEQKRRQMIDEQIKHLQEMKNKMDQKGNPGGK